MKEMTIRRERRRKQLLDDLKERRGYCKLTAEALDSTLWRTRFGRRHGPLVRQTAESIELIPWSRILPEKQTGTEIVKKFPAFCKTLSFITEFTKARHLSLC